MFGSVVEVAGAILFRDSLAVSDVPCTNGVGKESHFDDGDLFS